MLPEELWPDINHRELLQLLDLMARSREGELAFTPLRMHGFIRTLAGLWACSNKQCSHKAHELNQSDLPFGQVWFEQRQYCDCGAPVFEVLRCSGVVQLICLPKRRCAVMERTGW